MNEPAAARLFVDDALNRLRKMEGSRYQICITSPPYYQLRDYDHPDQIGHEVSVEGYIHKLLEVFDQVYRTLKSDGTCWVNIADSYQNKDLLCIPFKFALAMKERGWILRQDIIWSKSSVPPDSAPDRCVRAHEYIFMFAKQSKYFFRADRIRERGSSKTFGTPSKMKLLGKQSGLGEARLRMREEYSAKGFVMRNRRSVWNVDADRTRNSHIASYPVDLIRPMILACSDEKDIVLDPFAGTGTTAVCAIELDRNCDLIELNAEYIEIARERLKTTEQPAPISLLNEIRKTNDIDTSNAPFSLGSRLCDARNAAGLSKSELCRLAGVSRNALLMIEKDAGSVSTFVSLAKALSFNLPFLPPADNLGMSISVRRRQLKLSQSALAQRTALSVPAIRKLEGSGGSMVSLSKALRLLAPNIFWDQ